MTILAPIVLALAASATGGAGTVVSPAATSVSAAVGAEGASEEPVQDLTDLSLEELLGLEVTTVTRTEQKLSDVPAAVYVLTGEEIRRSGVTSVQEALRMVPGFYVSRYATSGWSVSARGFSGGFSNHLLVMIDGVTIYSPVFAGVWWELADFDMQDIDRIEIIRGPAGTLWGANAVNGIVHIITKHASETQGPMFYTSVGTIDRTATLRYGDSFGESGFWRAWLKGSDIRPLVDSEGQQWDDGYEIFNLGFRGDVESGNGDRWNVFGQGWNASVKEDYFVAFPAPPFLTFVHEDTPKQGGILSGSWQRSYGPGTSTRLQAWWLRDYYQEVDYDSKVDSIDADFSCSQALSDNNLLIWGLGYRLVMSELVGDYTLTFEPEQRNNQTFRSYVQDQISIPSKNLTFTLGAALQHNDLTGYEFQPHLAGTWRPAEPHTLWASWSRAVRTPSLEEYDSRYNIPIDLMGTFVSVHGSSEFTSESVSAFEAGWRWQAGQDVSLDLTGYYNDYDDLQTFEEGAPFFEGTNLFFPYFYDNLATAKSWGAELAVDWDVHEDWRIRSAYTYFKIESEVDPGSTEVTYPQTDGSFPENQLNLRSYYDLSEDWELDAALFYVDDVPYFDTPAYTRFNLRLGYNPSPDWKLSIGVQNLFHVQTPEEGHGNTGSGSEVPRVFYANLTWSK